MIGDLLRRLAVGGGKGTLTSLATSETLCPHPRARRCVNGGGVQRQQVVLSWRYR